MSLNIKSTETHELVQELAALTGETQTTAVTIAVRERLERVRQQSRTGLADRLLAIGADTAPRLLKATGEPLLYKGNDFTHKDVTSALPTAD